MTNRNVQLQNNNGDNLFPKTKGSLVYNNSNQALGGVEANAQVNIVETVKVNGSALTPDSNKAVNVDLTSYDTAITNINNTLGTMITFEELT